MKAWGSDSVTSWCLQDTQCAQALTALANLCSPISCLFLKLLIFEASKIMRTESNWHSHLQISNSLFVFSFLCNTRRCHQIDSCTTEVRVVTWPGPTPLRYDGISVVYCAWILHLSICYLSDVILESESPVGISDFTTNRSEFLRDGGCDVLQERFSSFLSRWFLHVGCCML